jgi:hypothetical protein
MLVISHATEINRILGEILRHYPAAFPVSATR